MVDIKLCITIITLKVNTPVKEKKTKKINKPNEEGGGGSGEALGRRWKKWQCMLHGIRYFKYKHTEN